MIKENINDFIQIIDNINIIKNNNENNNVNVNYTTLLSNLNLEIYHENDIVQLLKLNKFINIIELLFPNLLKSNILLLILKSSINFDRKLNIYVSIENLYNEKVFLNLNNLKSKLFYEFCKINNNILYKNKYWLKNFKNIFFNPKGDFKLKENNFKIKNEIKYNRPFSYSEIVEILNKELDKKLIISENYLLMKFKKYFVSEEIILNKIFLNFLLIFIYKNNKFFKLKNFYTDNQININNLKLKLKELNQYLKNEIKIKSIFPKSYVIIKNIFKNYSVKNINKNYNEKLFEKYNCSPHFINISEFNKFLNNYKINILTKSNFFEIFKFIKKNINGINFVLFFNMVLLLSNLNENLANMQNLNLKLNLSNFIIFFKLDNKDLLKSNVNKNQNLINKSFDYINKVEYKIDKIPLFVRTKLNKKIKRNSKIFNFKIQNNKVANRLYKPFYEKIIKNKNDINLKNKSILNNSLKLSTRTNYSNDIKNSYYKRKRVKSIVNNQSIINWRNINKIRYEDINFNLKYSNLNQFFKTNANKSVNIIKKDKDKYIEYGTFKTNIKIIKNNT